MFKKIVVYCLIFFLPCLASAKIVFMSERDGEANIYLMDDNGSNVQRLTFTQFPQYELSPKWSPDGTRIAFERDVSKHPTNQNLEIFLMDPDGSNVRQLTNDRALDSTGSWSPDGQHIAFTSTRNKGFDIYVINIITQDIEQLTHNPGGNEWAMDPSWAPNGRHIIYKQVINAGQIDKEATFYVMKPDGTGANKFIADDEKWGCYEPRWSPDSKSILYYETRWAIVKGFSKRVASNVVIQHYGSKERRVLNIPKNWLVHSACWMDNGKQVLIAAQEGMREQYDIYKYHLATGKITNLTNHPAHDNSMHWISDRVLSVTPRGKIALKWAELKK